MLPADVAVDFWLKPIAPENMPMTAAQLLADGYDSPALRDAAGFAAHDDPRDIRSAFQQALTELGAWVPDRTAAYARVGQALAAALLSGQVTKDECAARICEVIEFDEVIYHALPTRLDCFVRMCWLRGSGEPYEENGGDRQLAAAAAALVADKAR